MGFKKMNYHVDDYGITLPEAYAVIQELTIRGNEGTAMFVIQNTREDCFDKKEFAKIVVPFKFEDRTQNPYDIAYTEAKAHKIGEKFGKKFEYDMPFWDWEDDILENE